METDKISFFFVVRFVVTPLRVLYLAGFQTTSQIIQICEKNSDQTLYFISEKCVCVVNMHKEVEGAAVRTAEGKEQCPPTTL